MKMHYGSGYYWSADEVQMSEYENKYKLPVCFVAVWLLDNIKNILFPYMPHKGIWRWLLLGDVYKRSFRGLKKTENHLILFTYCVKIMYLK